MGWVVMQVASLVVFLTPQEHHGVAFPPAKLASSVCTRPTDQLSTQLVIELWVAIIGSVQMCDDGVRMRS